MTGRTKGPPELARAGLQLWVGLWFGGGVMGGAMGAERSPASGGAVWEWGGTSVV